MREPKNGMYLTPSDFEQWQDYLSPLIESHDVCTGNCATCKSKKTYEETEDPDLKVKNITFVVTERCNLDCTYCFAKNTMVTMSDYSKKPIQDIKIGDEVLSFKEKYDGSPMIVSKVEQLHHRKAKTISLLIEENDCIITLDVTPNHKILVKKDDNTYEFIEAGKIKKNDNICSYTNVNGLGERKILDIIIDNNDIDVYNIGTSERTYIANDILVHNCYECHKTGARMTKEVAKQAVDFIFDKEKVNGYYDFETSPALILEFIGGEPLLEIDLMNYIVEYFKFKAFELNHPWAENYMISITTNGVLYNTKKVQDFLKRNPGKVSIGITIDGNKELHDSCRVFPDGSGSYDIVEKAIKTWIKNDEHPQTKITLCPQNVMYLNDALKNVWGLGIIGAFTNCVFEEGWENKDAKILYSQMIELADYLLKDENYKKYYCSLFDDSIGKELIEDRNYCGGNGSMLAIAPDGRCFPCIRFMKYALSQPGRKEQPIGDIWNGLDSKEENTWLKELKKITMSTQCQYEDNKKCLDCPIASGCALCTGYNYDKFGDPNHKATFICEMHQARVLANYYYWNKLYKQLNLDEKFELNVPEEWTLKIIDKEELKNLKKICK